MGLYGAIHALGVVHHDPRPCHVLAKESGEMRIIDFDGAIHRGLDAVGQEYIYAEQKEVEEMMRDPSGWE